MRSSTAGLRRERTSFVGRRNELAELAALLERSALVTVLGAPGVGKTRLVQHFAREQEAGASREGPVGICDLGDARTEEDIVSLAAAALDIELGPGPGSGQQLAQALAERGPLLLVLDNFEHIVSLASATVGRWLDDAPEARLLVTSRERLRVEGELCLELRPLPEDEAVALLEDRALSVSADLRSASSVAHELVQRLDGLPLAIELAAARLNVLSPTQLLARLSQRFELLASDRRDATGRSTTLRAAIDWSWELLSEAEQSALTQCTVFRGGFSVEAAEAVVDVRALESVLGVLEGLRDKSMLRSYDAPELAGEPRFGLYESIREYAYERIVPDARRAAEQRHADAFVALGETWVSGLHGPDGVRCLKRIEIERANLTAAYERSAHARPEVAARAALVLDAVMLTNGPFDAHLTIVEGAVDAADRTADHALRSRAYLARAESRLVRNRLREALEDVDRSKAEATAAEREDLEAKALRTEGNLRRRLGEAARARAALDRSLELARRTGQRRLEASALGNIGIQLDREGLVRESIALKRRALEISRSIGDRRFEGIVVSSLAATCADLGAVVLADAYVAQALAIHREVGNCRDEAVMVAIEGEIAHQRSDLPRARERYEVAASMLHDACMRRLECLNLSEMSFLVHEEGNPDGAHELAMQALELARAIEEPEMELLTWSRLAALEALAGRLADAERALAIAEERVRVEGSPRHRSMLDVLEGIVDIGRARAARARGDAAEEAQRMTSARARLAAATDDWNPTSDLEEPPLLSLATTERRVAARVLERELARVAPGGATPEQTAAAADLAQPALPYPALELGPDLAWARPLPDGSRIDLSRRRVLRRVLRVLIAERLRAPGAPVTREALFDAAWPGDAADRHTAASRVWVTISSLRKLGLGAVLLTHLNGYLIDPRVEVRRSGAG